MVAVLDADQGVYLDVSGGRMCDLCVRIDDADGDVVVIEHAGAKERSQLDMIDTLVAARQPCAVVRVKNNSLVPVWPHGGHDLAIADRTTPRTVVVSATTGRRLTCKKTLIRQKREQKSAAANKAPSHTPSQRHKKVADIEEVCLDSLFHMVRR